VCWMAGWTQSTAETGTKLPRAAKVSPGEFGRQGLSELRAASFEPRVLGDEF
jgi:hypothetical protein